MITSEQLFHYLYGFPLQLMLSVSFFFIPLKKKEKWFLRLPLVLLMAAAEIGMWMLVFPRQPASPLLPRCFFALHYLMIFSI